MMQGRGGYLRFVVHYAATLSQEEFPVRIDSLTDETAYAIEAKKHHISTIEPRKPSQGAGMLSPAHSPA